VNLLLYNLRYAFAVVDPAVGIKPLVRGDGVVTARLHVDQKQHVGEGLNDPRRNYED